MFWERDYYYFVTLDNDNCIFDGKFSLGNMQLGSHSLDFNHLTFMKFYTQ